MKGKRTYTYAELKYKADKARLTAMKAETDWSYFYWQSVAEQLEEKALQVEVEI